MFLLDDILLSPLKGLAAVCRKVHEAALEDLEKQEKEILAALAELISSWTRAASATRTSTSASPACWTAWRPARKRGTRTGRRPARRQPGGRPWSMTPAAGQPDDSVLELLDRVLNTGSFGRRDRHHRGRHRADLPSLAVVAQLRGDRPAGGLALRTALRHGALLARRGLGKRGQAPWVRSSPRAEREKVTGTFCAK